MRLVLLLTFIFIGCRGPQGDMGVSGVVVPVTQPPNLDTIDDVVQEYNENRYAQGQDPVEQGLDCTLYTVPSGTQAIVGATLTNVGSFTYLGAFNQPNTPSTVGINVLPEALGELYSYNYVLKCTGLFVVTESNYYEFDLFSDDGANLYVNGLLVNNDGTHGVSEKSGTKFLSRGMASFELDYMDVGGYHDLVLASYGNLVSSENFYH